MSHPMRRSDRALSTEDSLSLLTRAGFGVLSTVGADGEPYGCPLNYCLSEDGTRLLFHAAPSGRKLENLRAHPHAHFTAFTDVEIVSSALSTCYASVMVEGSVEEITDREEKIAVACRIAEHFGAPFDPRGYAASVEKGYVVFALAIESVSGKRRTPMSPEEVEEFARKKSALNG